MSAFLNFGFYVQNLSKLSKHDLMNTTGCLYGLTGNKLLFQFV